VKAFIRGLRFVAAAVCLALAVSFHWVGDQSMQAYDWLMES
jgi:hypothetical protein